MNDFEIVRGVAVNVFLLLGFVSACSLASGWMVRHDEKINVCLMGFLFGMMAMVSMFCPVLMRSGLHLDCRAGVIGAAALLGGAGMALPSLVLPVCYRLSQGGWGMGPGICEMLFAATLGMACHAWFRRAGERLSMQDMLFGAAIVGFGTDLLMLVCFMPDSSRLYAELGLGGFLALHLLIPVSMALLGAFILREQYHDELLDAVVAGERKVFHSQKMAAVGQFSHRVAHSVLNALAVILGNAELAKVEAGEKGGVRPIMDNIIASVNSLSALTGQLVAFSTPCELRFHRIDLSKCLVGVEQLVSKVIASGIEVEIRNSRSVGIVNVDPDLVEQSIVHMAINAADAMEGQGRLVISTGSCELSRAERRRLQAHLPEAERHDGAFAVLSVQDTGCGMSDEVRERIFEPFFSTKGRHVNAGLGLATVFSIVQKHRGMIDVRTRPGEGTTFLLYFPVVA